MGRPGAAKGGGGGVGGSLHSLQHAAVVKVKAARTMDFTAVFRIRIQGSSGSGSRGKKKCQKCQIIASKFNFLVTFTTFF